MHIYITIIKERRGHEYLKKEWKGIWEGLKGGKGRKNDVIIL